MTTDTHQNLGSASVDCNEHQAIEVKGKDGKTHQFWARSAKEAFQDATKWSYRHEGLHDVYLLILQDSKEGCWERAIRVPFGRQCSLPLILAREIALRGPLVNP